MKIGITFDLRTDSNEDSAEFDKISTIEHIESTLGSLGYETERIGNFKDLLRELNSYNVYSECDMIFNICEGLYGVGREAQVPALLDAHRIPYTFSDPFVLCLTLNKGMTKRIIRDAGLPTAPFTIINKIQDIYDIKLNYPLFVKPNGEGSGIGINGNSKVNNLQELKNVCLLCLPYSLNPLYPLIIEEYLPGREFTVGIIGTGDESVLLGCMEINFNSDEKLYSYNMKTNYEEFITYTLPEEEMSKKVCDLALKSWKLLGCRDSGRIDVRLDENGVPNFIEVNPLAGLNKDTSDLPILAKMNGFSYEYIIESIINSAKKRIKK